MKEKCTIRIMALAFVACAALASCKKDNDDPVLPEPSVDNVEIGIGNNGIGIIGQDFHFEMDVLAGERIETVQVRIVQRAEETYEKEWGFEVTWEQYKGAKNTNVHKHFRVPEDAVEGAYDFVITVNDQNGTALEEKREISVYNAENLPVDPKLTLLTLNNNGTFFYRNGKFTEEGATLSKDDKFSAQVTIDGVKGDGKMYLLLINKKLGHIPESIDQIDFDKAIVLDVYEHKGWEEGGSFSNAVFDGSTFTWVRKIPQLVIGAASDNNTPEARAIDGDKAWQSGSYYFGVLYENTTYNMSYFEYLEFGIGGF